jgi:hypothetical protein
MRRAPTSSLEQGSAGFVRVRACVFCALLAVGFVAAVVAPCTRAHAQTPTSAAAATQPARFVGILSSGAALRLSLHEELGQQRLAPAYVDALLGYVVGSSRSYRYGAALGVSSNLSDDGGFAEPVYAGEQLVLMPAGLGYLELTPDLPLYTHVGLPILLGIAGRSFGLEFGAALGYRVLAGMSAIGGLDLTTFVGSRARLNVLVSLELGVAFEYEVLP